MTEVELKESEKKLYLDIMEMFKPGQSNRTIILARCLGASYTLDMFFMGGKIDPILRSSLTNMVNTAFDSAEESMRDLEGGKFFE